MQSTAPSGNLRVDLSQCSFIWVNYHKSLIWKVRLFWNDSPYKPVNPVREKSEVVIIYPDLWLNCKRCICFIGIAPWPATSRPALPDLRSGLTNHHLTLFDTLQVPNPAQFSLEAGRPTQICRGREDWLYLKRKKDHSHTVIPKNKWLWFNHNQLEQHKTSQTCNHGAWSSILYTFLYTVGLKTRKTLKPPTTPLWWVVSSRIHPEACWPFKKGWEFNAEWNLGLDLLRPSRKTIHPFGDLPSWSLSRRHLGDIFSLILQPQPMIPKIAIRKILGHTLDLRGFWQTQKKIDFCKLLLKLLVHFTSAFFWGSYLQTMDKHIPKHRSYPPCSSTYRKSQW